jgi:hypothetical protein
MDREGHERSTGRAAVDDIIHSNHGQGGGGDIC